jgi:myo-inositol catabolism protein IolC
MSDLARRVDEFIEQDVEAETMFEPDVIAVMRTALEASWSALAFAHFDDEQEMRSVQEELARRILEGAARGERRAPVLSGRALGAIAPRRAGKSQGAMPWRATRYAS